MHIVSVINYKGGVGKTTVTANIASELAYRGKKVLLIDTDAQASLTFSFLTPDDWDTNYKATKTIKSWFDAISQSKEPPSLTDFVITPPAVNRIVARNGGKIDLICSHLGLINVDLELATLLGGVNLPAAKRNYLKVHGQLRQALATVAAEAEYDIVLIDCPPNFNIVTKNAIVASEQILIPAKPDYLSTLGIDYLQRSVRELVKDFNEFAGPEDQDLHISPQILGVIFTMIQIYDGQPIAAQRQFIAQTKRLGVPTLANNFRENKTIFADAPQNLMPVVLTGYSSNSHSDIVQEIERVVDEFSTLLGGV
ncbi:ParA family protein [Pelomonas sp. Root1444]|uniref:ParA family protein n=1 Tax=Pelomonas sp. Root1444 TaxID=1736464 RepID=UPI0007025DA3|nr:AAA family ATPase [Pelomonas sp. Root1444]KQY85972.1 cobyrinic acid a,c-diamide synthase [Pelomonas sp. Root1444]